jgi:hypothetical protein
MTASCQYLPCENGQAWLTYCGLSRSKDPARLRDDELWDQLRSGGVWKPCRGCQPACLPFDRVHTMEGSRGDAETRLDNFLDRVAGRC